MELASELFRVLPTVNRARMGAPRAMDMSTLSGGHREWMPPVLHSISPRPFLPGADTHALHGGWDGERDPRLPRKEGYNTG